MLVTCQRFGNLGWSGSILQIRTNVIKVGSKAWLINCSSNKTLSLTSYTGSALQRKLNFCNDYLSLLYFQDELISENMTGRKMGETQQCALLFVHIHFTFTEYLLNFLITFWLSYFPFEVCTYKVFTGPSTYQIPFKIF